MNDTECNIAGDAKDYKGCLILACGTSEERAKETLNRLLTSLTEGDKMAMKVHTNIRIEKVDKGNCWWNEGCN